MATKTRELDAVEMSRRLREDTSRLLSSMSRQEKRDFLNRHLDRFPEKSSAKRDSLVLDR